VVQRRRDLLMLGMVTDAWLLPLDRPGAPGDHCRQELARPLRGIAGAGSSPLATTSKLSTLQPPLQHLQGFDHRHISVNHPGNAAPSNRKHCPTPGTSHNWQIYPSYDSSPSEGSDH
jgi:hypothetical protein